MKVEKWFGETVDVFTKALKLLHFGLFLDVVGLNLCSKGKRGEYLFVRVKSDDWFD
jgi:hypothetical protein